MAKKATAEQSDPNVIQAPAEPLTGEQAAQPTEEGQGGNSTAEPPQTAPVTPANPPQATDPATQDEAVAAPVVTHVTVAVKLNARWPVIMAAGSAWGQNAVQLRVDDPRLVELRTNEYLTVADAIPEPEPTEG